MNSVTEILDALTEPELLAWMLRTPKTKREQVSEESKMIGTIVDRMIQRDLGRVVDIPVVLPLYKLGVENCMAGWNQFKNEHQEIIGGIKEIQPELVWDEIVGHPDIIYDDRGEMGIIDVKTSSSVYPKYWTQTAQYSFMKCLLTGRTLAHRFIAVLRLDKKSGKYEFNVQRDEEFLRYERELFIAYRMVFEHNARVREVLRQQLEREVFDVA